MVAAVESVGADAEAIRIGFVPSSAGGAVKCRVVILLARLATVSGPAVAARALASALQATNCSRASTAVLVASANATAVWIAAVARNA